MASHAIVGSDTPAAGAWVEGAVVAPDHRGPVEWCPIKPGCSPMSYEQLASMMIHRHLRMRGVDPQERPFRLRGMVRLPGSSAAYALDVVVRP